MRTLDEVRSIEDDWFALAESLDSAALTQYPEYTLACLHAFETFGDSSFIAAVFSDSGLVAVFPLSLSVRRRFGLQLPVLAFPDYPVPVRDVLVSPDVSPEEVFDTLMSRLGSLIGFSWVFMDFRGVLESSVLVELAGGRDYSSFVHTDFSHLLIVKDDNYVGSVLKSKARNNLRRNHKKLAERGSYEFRTYSDFPGLEQAYEEFLITEAAGWKSVKGGKRAVALHDDQTEFYRDLVRRGAERSRAHIHVLYLNGQPIASDLCILTGGSCYSLKHGYDEKYSSFAPGNLLREYTVEYYGRDPTVNAIDLVSGMKWHLTWQPLRRKVFDVRFYNRTLLGRLMHFKASMQRSTSEAETSV